MTSGQYALYALGYTGATVAGTKGSEAARWSKSQKPCRGADWGLQLTPMKAESVVMANQQCRREYVPGSCTHRPSRHGSWVHRKSPG